MLSTLLIEMDGVNTNKDSQVLVLAATNKPEMMDPAILRPGRFDQQIMLPIPAATERLDIIKHKLRGVPVKLTEHEDAEFNSMVLFGMAGCTGADLENWCRESVMVCLRENISNEYVLWKHFAKAKSLI
jgi:SpoVK/Ycf46/Vps4 family AAA+-type ATPase